MSAEDIDLKARNIGKVYVLKPYRAERDYHPFRPNAAAIILRRLDESYGFTDPDARAWLDKDENPEDTRAWCNAAWDGLYLPRGSDTWERVFPVLKFTEHHGATAAEVADAAHIGRGAVSACLSYWAEAGVAYRLKVTPP